MWPLLRLAALFVAWSTCASVYAIGSTSWKEEVLLHDGSRIVVTRAQSYGGRQEIGQSSPIREHSVTFALPGTTATITWVSEYSAEIGRTNFNVLALHILNGMPYIVASPNLCLSYNKWGRPNPPYVLFIYESQEWRRIPLSQLPAEFKTINLAVGIRGREGEQLVRRGLTSAEEIAKLNEEVRVPEFKTIVREPLANAREGCGEMFYDGRGGWRGLGWFRDQPTYDACLKYCGRYEIQEPYCPCTRLFNRQ